MESMVRLKALKVRFKLGTRAHAWSSSTQELKVERWKVGGASLGYSALVASIQMILWSWC
jgi:hypothetical protein